VISASVIGDNRLSALGAHVGFAAVAAATSTAIAVRRGLQEEMRRGFDRPTSYALNAFAVSPATSAHPIARVFAKDGTRWLKPQIDGGARIDKRSETMLRQAGVLPAGMQAVPGKAAKLDAYGNMDRAQMIALLSAVRVFNVAGFTANRRWDGTSRGVYRNHDFFVMHSSGKLPPGVYLRDTRAGKVRRGKSAAPVLVFVKRPAYQARFDFHGVAAKLIAAEYPRCLRDAMAKWAPR
jgi:hypothetical protein